MNKPDPRVARSARNPGRFAAEILLSLNPDESLDEDDREWIAEIQSRREEASRGAVVMRPWSDVRDDLRKDSFPVRT